MSNEYKVGLLAAAFMLLSFNPVMAQLNTPVGLDANYVRMSSHEQKASRFSAPTKLWSSAITQNALGYPLDAEAQQDDQLIGAGLAYGSEIEKLGIQLSYYYFLTAALAIGGDFIFFFPESATFNGVKTTASFYTLNVMAHYIFFTTLTMRAYALAGLNFAIFGFKTSGGGVSFSDSSSELGLNVGAGLEFALAAGFLYLELKYILGQADQLVAAAGYRIRLGN